MAVMVPCRRSFPLTLSSVLALAGMSGGCGHGRVLPAATAQTIIGAPTSAVTTQNGVRLAISSDVWRGDPEDLGEYLTPMKVRITNNSGKPVRILYQDFAFRGKSGRLYRVRPVVPIDHDRSQTADAPIKPVYTATNFFVAPRLRDVYRCCEAWPQPLPRDESLYAKQYHSWKDELPTREMKRESLPEGVLADGGVITGFLYFDDVARREKGATFEAHLEDGEGGAEVADLTIPFRVE